jgi:hypothetical protein
VISALSLAALLLALAFPARAQVLFDNFWVPNGAVEDLAIVDDAVYLGGSFTQVGPATGAFVGLDATTGAALQPLPRVVGPILPPGGYFGVTGQVFAVVSDGAGGWYIGGKFGVVRGQPRTNLAHLDAAGNVTAWNPGADNYVYALARDAATGVVLAGGSFASVGGQTRWRLAAIDASGAVTAFDAGYVDQNVYALAVQGSTLYAAGTFTSVAAQTRTRAASFNATTGALTSWAPSIDGWVTCMGVHETTTATHVYLGGYFTHVDGIARNCLAMVDGITGGLGSWNPVADQPVFAMALAGGTSIFNPLRVYVGGDFQLIGGSPRSFVAQIDEAGAVQGWNPGANNTVYALHPAGNLVYVGGDFASIGGQAIRHLAAIDATGAATSWDPMVGGPVFAVVTTGSAVFAGGQFWTVNGVKRDRLAALSRATGVATPWNPGSDGTILALTADAGTIYVGGLFTTIGGQARSRLAALDAATGAVTAWSPNANDYVESIAVGPGVVYAGGAFTTIGGQSRSYIAALDAATALATGWNPSPDGQVHVVAVDGATVYAAGLFNTIGGLPHWRFAALNAGTGQATGWNPNPGPDANGVTRVEEILFSGPNVVVGGYFGRMGNRDRRGLAFLDKTTGIANTWDLFVQGGGVTGLAIEGSTIYLGGNFGGVSGANRNGLAAIDANTGVLLPYNPSFYAPAGPLVVKDGTVCGGGYLSSEHATFAVFFDPTTDVDVVDADTKRDRLSATPNPFPSQVVLRFSLPRDDEVDITVHDLAGRLVRRLERGTRPAGEQRVLWDGRDQGGCSMEAGVYLVRVRTESLLLTAKVLRIE